MNDLNEINEEFFKPYSTVMEYIGLTGLNIFDEKKRGFFSIRYFYVFYFIFHVISMICHWMFIMREFSKGTKLIEIPIDFSYCNNNLEALLIFIQLFRSKDHIKAFVFKIEKEWRKDENLSLELISMKRRLVKETHLYNYISCLSVSVMCSIFLLNPVIMVLINKFILHKDVTYAVALGLATPFNYEDNLFNYILLSMAEYRLATIVAYEMQCSQYIITISMNYLRILFFIIQVEFKEVIAMKNNADKEKLLKETMNRHSKLLDLLANVSNTFGYLFAINYIFLSSTICFCIISACVNGSLEDLKILCISILVIINVFYCCKSGENLVNAALQVSTAIYDTPWYECSTKHKKIILFIMMRSQRVAYVTATSFIKISLTTFIRIMNMTWSFISLITTVYDK